IRQVQRDPGVLWYKTGNRIGFHIYPFSGGEIRQTGIELMHKEPVTLSMDGKSVNLGDTLHTGNVSRSGFVEGVDYLSGDEKRNLKRVVRKPYFHFILDISAGAQSSAGMYYESLDYLMENYAELSEGARFSFVNSSVSTIENGKQWFDELKEQQFKGGFFLDRAIRSLLAAHYLEQSGTYPVFVVVSGNPGKAVILDDFGDLEFTYPDEDRFYFMGNDWEPYGHALFNNPGVVADSIPGIRRPRSVLAYHASDGSKIHVPDNGEPSVVIVPSGFSPEAIDAPEGLWNKALHQQGLWRWFKLHPDQEGKNWRTLVRSSFTTGIMTPLTSYIVVENEAQKAALLRKQKQVMDGHRQLDLNDEVVSMSEPGLLIPVILLAALLGFRLRKTGFTF
ncbi:MAG: MSEP-CTERM sorting domain-containing protein, partial [Bacteroidales bacterium]